MYANIQSLYHIQPMTFKQQQNSSNFRYSLLLIYGMLLLPRGHYHYPYCYYIFFI